MEREAYQSYDVMISHDVTISQYHMTSQYHMIRYSLYAQDLLQQTYRNGTPNIVFRKYTKMHFRKGIL